MIRMPMRRAVQSARATARAQQKKAKGGQRKVSFTKEQQHSAFGRSSTDTMFKAVTAQTAGLLDRSAFPQLPLVLDELIVEEDDDGR